MGMQYLVQIIVVRLASSTLCQSVGVTVSGVSGAPMPSQQFGGQRTRSNVVEIRLWRLNLTP
jgi:hypothetical protein